MLTWKAETDDSQNTYYTVESAFVDPDDGDFVIACEWFVTQKFERDHVFWSIEESNLDLTDNDLSREFDSAFAAKAYCEAREAELLAKA